MTDATIKPANQKRRLNLLRAAAALLLPLFVFSRSAWSEPEWLFDLFEVTGIFLVIAAVLGRFWAILYIGGRKNAEVLQDGPYSLCRHPLYLFSLIGTLGFGLMLGSVVLTAALGLLVLLILSRTAAGEEAFLHAEFGPAYARYAATTPRLVPRLSNFHTRAHVTFSVETLRRNFFDALVFLSFIPLAELLEGLKEAHTVPTFLIY